LKLIILTLRRTFIDADSILIYLKDEKLKYIFVNQAFEISIKKSQLRLLVAMTLIYLMQSLLLCVGKRILPIIVNDFEMPNSMKKGYPEGHVQLSKFMSIPVFLDNEIVAVVGLANKEDDYDETDIYQVTVLMNGVWNAKERRERIIELEKTTIALKEKEAKLQLLLDSTYEAIYGIDMKGSCTFCNDSCLKLLGYRQQDELMGKNMHWQIHHSRKDGTLLQLDECQVFTTLIKGEGVHVDNEVLWRADGTSFDAEFFAYPQYKDGEFTGAVVTFMDITNRKKAETEIAYLSYHDSLKGLYNRRFFEEELSRLDIERNLPISIIMGDVNGFKANK